VTIQDLQPSIHINGILPSESVQVISAQAIGGDAVDLVYHKRDGSLGQRLLYAESLAGLSRETGGLPWTFDADAARVRLASEALRTAEFYLAVVQSDGWALQDMPEALKAQLKVVAAKKIQEMEE